MMLPDPNQDQTQSLTNVSHVAPYSNQAVLHSTLNATGDGNGNAASNASNVPDWDGDAILKQLEDI